MIRKIIAQIPLRSKILYPGLKPECSYLFESTRYFARARSSNPGRKPTKEEISDYERLPKEIEDQSLGLYIHPEHSDPQPQTTKAATAEKAGNVVSSDSEQKSWNWIPPRDSDRTDDEIIPVIEG